jgi:mRNA-degrading endonuclease RelE of RelBE toxin-antitoxin system
MKFEVRFVPSAYEDLGDYEVHEQRIIREAIGQFLEMDADVQSKRRKPLGSNPLAPWKMRVGDFRVFYEIRADAAVRVLAAGQKRHNELFILGRKVER